MSPFRNPPPTSTEIARELKLLKGLLRITISVDSLSVLLDNAVRLLLEILPADGVFIYLREEDAPVLTLRATSRYLPDLLGKFSIRLGEGLTGWVAAEESPVIVPERAYEDPRAKLFQMIPEDLFPNHGGLFSGNIPEQKTARTLFLIDKEDVRHISGGGAFYLRYLL